MGMVGAADHIMLFGRKVLQVHGLVDVIAVAGALSVVGRP